MDIHKGIRGFSEIHVWICYGFSDQGYSHAYVNTREIPLRMGWLRRGYMSTDLDELCEYDIAVKQCCQIPEFRKF